MWLYLAALHHVDCRSRTRAPTSSATPSSGRPSCRRRSPASARIWRPPSRRRTTRNAARSAALGLDYAESAESVKDDKRALRAKLALPARRRALAERGPAERRAQGHGRGRARGRQGGPAASETSPGTGRMRDGAPQGAQAARRRGPPAYAAGFLKADLPPGVDLPSPTTTPPGARCRAANPVPSPRPRRPGPRGPRRRRSLRTRRGGPARVRRVLRSSSRGVGERICRSTPSHTASWSYSSRRPSSRSSPPSAGPGATVEPAPGRQHRRPIFAHRRAAPRPCRKFRRAAEKPASSGTRRRRARGELFIRRVAQEVLGRPLQWQRAPARNSRRWLGEPPSSPMYQGARLFCSTKIHIYTRRAKPS